MNKIIRWGVLGCSGIGDAEVLPAINEAKNAELYGIASRSNMEKLKKFADKHKPVKTYNSYEELLNDPQIDAVYLPLPNSEHMKWIEKSANLGKNILCEKPMAVSAIETENAFNICKQKGVILQEAFAYRHSNVILKAKEMVDNGVIGRLRLVESYFDYPMQDTDNIRCKRENYGGATYDVGSYNINFIRYIVGKEPNSVWAVGEINKEGIDTTSLSVLSFDKGVKGISHCSFDSGFRNEFCIMGDIGRIEGKDGFNSKGKLKLTVKKGDSFFNIGKNYEEIVVDSSNCYVSEIERFGESIISGQKIFISKEDTCGNAEIVDKVLSQIGYKQ